jgi:hypothetical protein
MGLFLDQLGCQAQRFPHMLPNPTPAGEGGREGGEICSDHSDVWLVSGPDAKDGEEQAVSAQQTT